MASKELLENDKIRLGAFGSKAALGGMALGIGGLAVSIGVGLAQGDSMSRFLHAYLLAVTFCLTFSLGGLFFVIIQHLVRAEWSVTVRRTAEILSQTVPIMGVLTFAGILLPMLIGNHSLYIWTNNDLIGHDHVIQNKAWLSIPFFSLRIAAYFVIWTFLARYFHKQSVLQDQTGDPEISTKLRVAAGPSIVIFGLTCGFAGIDLLMTLTPHWYSTMWPVYFFAGCTVAIFALLVLVPMALQRAGLVKNSITTEHYHDVGKLLFAFTFFWGYVAFSQFMLVWYADLPEETVWFKIHMFDSAMTANGHLIDWVNWKWLSGLLLLGHFCFPFMALLSRETKRQRWLLGLLAAWMLLMHLVDLYWIIMPSYDINAYLVEGAHLYTWGISKLLFIDLAAVVGVVGIFVAVAAKAGQRVNLVPTKDPALPESLAFENY